MFCVSFWKFFRNLELVFSSYIRQQKSQQIWAGFWWNTRNSDHTQTTSECELNFSLSPTNYTYARFRNMLPHTHACAHTSPQREFCLYGLQGQIFTQIMLSAQMFFCYIFPIKKEKESISQIITRRKLKQEKWKQQQNTKKEFSCIANCMMTCTCLN